MKQYTRLQAQGNFNALSPRPPVSNTGEFAPSFSGSEGHQGQASRSRVWIFWETVRVALIIVP